MNTVFYQRKANRKWTWESRDGKVKDHNEENRKRYKEITKNIRKKAKRCKEKWIEGKCQEIEDTNGIVHTGKLYQVAREICGTVNTRLASVKNKEGKPLDNK